MNIQLIYLLLICFQSTFCQSVQHCIYTESFQLMNGNNQMMNSQWYYFTFNWQTVQSNILSSSFALSGYQMNILHQYMSFYSDIHIVTSTYVFFHYYPYSSSFFRISFYFILSISCTDQIILQRITYSGSTNSVSSIPLGFSIGTDLSRYQSMVFYKQIRRDPPGITGYLQINLLTMIAGNTFQRIQIKTSISISLQIGYMLLIKNTNQALIQIFQSYSAAGYKPLIASSVFAPNAQHKCFLGLKLFNQLPDTNLYYTMKPLNYTSNQTYGIIYDYVKSSQNHGMFFLFCLAKCPSPFVPNYTSPQLNCSALILPFCLQIISYQCTLCQTGYYLDSNFTCQPCPTHLSDCLQCSFGNCSKCSVNYIRSVQGSNASCVTCDTAFQNCQICSQSACVVCIQGLYPAQICTAPGNCTQACLNCLQQCLTCASSHSCITCKSGAAVEGGCTNIQTCTRVNSSLSYSSLRCLQCSYPNFADSKGGCSRCHPGYLFASPYCTKTIGCMVTIKQNQAIICITCKIYQNFLINPIDSICHCRDGFALSDNICKQICGDGYVYTVECDDGNLANGDGCSSNCTVQDGFACKKQYNLLNVTTNCRYYRNDIKLKLKSIEKVRFEDKAIMTFQFQPKLLMHKLIDISEGIMFLTNRSIQIENRQLTANVLTLWISYNQDLEDYDAILIVFLKNTTFYQQKTEVSFKMQKDGLLIITKNASLLALETKIVHYLSIAIMVIYLLSIFFQRMLGLQFIFPFQIIYLLYISDNHPTSFIHILNPLGLTCFNFLVYRNDYSNILTNGSVEEFSEGNLEFSIISMFFSISVLTIMKIIKIILSFCHDNQENRIKLGQTKKIFFFIIDNFLFSLSLSFMIISFLLLTNKSLHNSFVTSKLMMVVIQTVVSLQFFQSWYQNNLDKNHKEISKQIVSTKPIYTHILLSCYAFTSSTVVTAFQNILPYVQIILSGIMLMFFLMVIIYRPYKTFIDNFGIIFSIILTLFFLIWFKIRKQIVQYRHEQSQLFFLVLFIAFMFLSGIITIIRILKSTYIIYKKCCKQDSILIVKSALKTDIKTMQIYKIKAQQEKNRYNFGGDIPIREFEKASRQNRDIKNKLLKKPKYYKNKISKDIPNQ